MKRQTKSTSPEQEHQQAAEQQTRQASAQEFVSVEAMLRHDVLHTPVPPTIAHRLRSSMGPSLPAARSWWRRIIGK